MEKIETENSWKEQINVDEMTMKLKKANERRIQKLETYCESVHKKDFWVILMVTESSRRST